MPLILDDSLDPSLYPLAWLVGTWEGEGAIHLAGEGSSPQGRRIEQHLSVTPTDDAELRWHMRTWVYDSPAPEPPTSAFYEPTSDTAASAGTTEPIRELLLDERGTWRTTGTLPGQNEAAAAKAKPGTPQSYLSHGVTLTMQRTTGFGSGTAEHWVGEVRGPRIQLATHETPDPAHPGSTLEGARMFGLVGGNLMWLQEVGPSVSDLHPYLSVELRRTTGDATETNA